MATRQLFTVLLLTAPAALHGQSEALLKEYFEGKTVRVKIAMPGTEKGVDVHPEIAKPLDFPRHASRLKDNGTALKAGDEALVTKIKVKSKHIEFQLDGGGYGTMGDETSSSVSVGDAPKTEREQNLEDGLEREMDPANRRAIKEELDDLKASRERENARNRASVAEAEESKKANIRQRRLEGGSRFNIRYRDGLPAAVMTPKGIREVLAAYVEFPEAMATAAPATPPALPIANAPAPRPAPAGLPMKGMIVADVDQLLGTPRKSTDRMEGRLKVTSRVYSASAGLVTAEFVEGVLIRYTLTSN